MQKILLYLCGTIFDIFGKKYSDGRQSASAIGTNITTADRVLAPIKERTFLAKIGYASTGESILTADRMLAYTGYGTLTAVRVLAPIGE